MIYLIDLSDVCKQHAAFLSPRHVDGELERHLRALPVLRQDGRLADKEVELRFPQYLQVERIIRPFGTSERGGGNFKKTNLLGDRIGHT